MEKKIKFNDNNNINSASIRNRTDYSEEFQKKFLNCIMISLIDYLEAQQSPHMYFQFPKEMLKYFLATYQLFIKPVDFVSTNIVSKPERKKNTSTLVNGAILYEYTKGFDHFISNMTRCNQNDIMALKIIVANQLAIPHQIYDILNNFNFKPSNYVIDQIAEYREGYIQIVTANSKQLYVLITNDIILYYDGNQFAIPQSNIERDFSSNIKNMPKSSKKSNYMLLEVISTTKMKVIDLLMYCIDDKTDLPTLYKDRLDLVRKTLPNINIVTYSTIQQNVTAGDYSYIQKPSNGFGPSYMYHKSALIAAAIGIVDKSVVLAFLDNNNNNDLVIKSKAPISGPVSCCLTIMSYSTNNNTSKIMMNSKEYNVVGDLTNIKLFKSCIIVELRDCNRLGLISTKPISKVSDFKPVTLKKETSMLIQDVSKKFDNENMSFVNDLLTNLMKSSVSLSDEIKSVMRRWLDPNVAIPFDDYNTLNLNNNNSNNNNNNSTINN